MSLQRTMATVAGALLFILGAAAAALADGTTTTTTTTAATTTATITAAPITTTTETTTAAATTAMTTASSTPMSTVTPATSTTTTVAIATTTVATTSRRPSTRRPAEATAARSISLAHGCLVAAAALLLPDHTPLVLGPIAHGRDNSIHQDRIRYPANGSILTTASATLDEGVCTNHGRTHARAQLTSLSLFRGEITAVRITLTPGARNAASAIGLTANGRHTSTSGATRIPLQNWGYLVVGQHAASRLAGGAVVASAIAVHLLRAHAGLPAGTVVLIAFARVPAAAQMASAAATHKPLKVRPPLGLRHYVFPVAGPSAYVDTYGAFRSDVPGDWHHGDDIFAPLGTPVVAIASGTINRVGWEAIGGWRLWVRDRVGDEFYYAHLSGYAPTDFRSNRVEAGEVIGFIGNTGDAFTTSPHLHFEIHPRQLLHLDYDGAVDPTTYLNGWTHLRHAHVPRPTHPPLPTQPLIRQEAGYVFRELLAARHLIRHAPDASQRPHIHIPAGANGPSPQAGSPAVGESIAAPPHPGHASSSSLATILAAGLGLLALALTMLLHQSRRRRRTAARDLQEDPAPSAAE